MVLLVASLGRRIEEAMGCNRATSTKTTCCTPACGLWGKVEVLEKEQLLPPLEQRGIRFPFAFFTGFTVPLHLFPVRSRFFSKLFGLSVAHATPEMLVFAVGKLRPCLHLFISISCMNLRCSYSLHGIQVPRSQQVPRTRIYFRNVVPLDSEGRGLIERRCGQITGPAHPPPRRMPGPSQSALRIVLHQYWVKKLRRGVRLRSAPYLSTLIPAAYRGEGGGYAY